MAAPASFDRKTTPQVEDGDAFFIGLNSRLAADKLPPGYVAAAQNVRMRNGQIEPCKGVVKPGWLNNTNLNGTINPVGKFYGSGVFRDPLSREWTFLAADGNIFRCAPHNTRFAVPLPTGVRVLSTCSFTQAFNKLWCWRGRSLAPLVLADGDAGFADVVQHWSASATYNAAVLATGQTAEEIAYGPFLAVTSLTSVGDMATCVTTLAHGYVTGADVTIKGAVEVGYNGRWNITVVDETTFTFQFSGATASPATGTPVVSNMARYYRALGSLLTLTSLTSAGTTATATKNGHGFTSGQYVTIAGAAQAEYNGTYLITVTGVNAFTYVFPGSGTTPATGTITARTSIVLAAQSPDTNAEAWQQIYNVVPNADDALYINNRLLIPTAYTPGAATYDATSNYTKKDFIVATDIFDDVHFDFQNEFRINQGSDDEIVALVKYGPETAIVVKGKSWGVLTNIAVDLSSLNLDMHADGYGGCAARSVIVAGKDVLFPALKRGVVSIVQNLQGQLRSVDVPFSNDIPAEIGRINWNYADKIRMAYWDDKLYAAVPLDDGRAYGVNAVARGATYSQPFSFGAHIYTVNLVPGQLYKYVPGNELSVILGNSSQRVFVATTPWILSGATATTPVTAQFLPIYPETNNAILVHDYRAGERGAWQGYDARTAICPIEFFKAVYNGVERLFFIGADGFTSMVEEATAGDQNLDVTAAPLLGFYPIATAIDSRGYRFDTEAQKNFKMLQCVLGVWDAQFSISVLNGRANESSDVVTDKTFSRTQYLRPFDKAAYVDGNVNNDFATPGRGNYAVYLPSTGLLCGTGGISAGQFQEVTARAPLPKTIQRYAQVQVTNAAGRCLIKSITPIAAEGQRRGGTFI